METETNTIRPATYDEWLSAHRRWGDDATYVLYALEQLASVDQWTPGKPGQPVLIYVHTTADPKPYLRRLVLAGLAEQVEPGVWQATAAGRALDYGRTIAPGRTV